MSGESDYAKAGPDRVITHPSPGLAVTARCDECSATSAQARTRAKVKHGALRGLLGMVCRFCLAKRNG